ncbi:hypothetical protein R3P38DRAFT_2811923 [Favolaschia claudopus]|uniref:Uncharacterized protein n=1 Tax=Favolaschia claudopus TaxID=2862362 RepID=A0AAV9ZA19_9AGAR
MPTKSTPRGAACYNTEMLSFPPMNFKHADPPTSFQAKFDRVLSRRAELKSRPLAEQAAAAERERKYHAVYRARHREKLRTQEAQRRLDIYEAKHGPDVLEAYLDSLRDRRRERILKHFDTRGRKRG